MVEQAETVTMNKQPMKLNDQENHIRAKPGLTDQSRVSIQPLLNSNFYLLSVPQFFANSWIQLVVIARLA